MIVEESGWRKENRKDVRITSFTNYWKPPHIRMIHEPTGIWVEGICKRLIQREELWEELERKVNEEV